MVLDIEQQGKSIRRLKLLNSYERKVQKIYTAKGENAIPLEHLS